VIKEKNTHNTMLRTRYNHYELTVVPFGLTNASTTFMCLLNIVFNKYLDEFVLVFLDGILIYSSSEEECEEHLRMVLQVLKEHNLYPKLSTCGFYQNKIWY
jgi:hypothetical protein